MRRSIILYMVMLLTASLIFGQKAQRNAFYITNQPPLAAQPYTALPLGAIHPEGWLLKMLELQRDGLTGQLDSVYRLVCGPDNGWLGGQGDCWERGPYWIDGLVPLAYILDDPGLKAKVQEWIEWSIANQRENGYFGPYPLDENAPKIKGTQQTNSEDWWPKMVMLKALQQYYTATKDERVIKLMSGYFRYELENLPANPLGKWTFWAEQRGGDNLQVVYWLYNITREKYLLELAELIHKQTFPWTTVYSDNTLRCVNPYPDLHCVNVAQGLKEPVIYYQQHPDQKYIDAVKEGLDALHDCHGFVNGMYGADENLHGNDPTQGSELCSAIEMMYSFESIIPITGDVYFADYLEKVAFNVLPTQIGDRFMRRQYFQQVNQVLITDEFRNFDIDGNARICFGTTTGYPCCLTNMHQGWPKFVQNLWYATADNGLAALVYGASRVKAFVAGGKEAEFLEETAYPFSDRILFTYTGKESLKFPLHLRIPGWCETPAITVNGQAVNYTGGGIVVINRTWNENDKVELTLPMKVRLSRWYENSLGIERGPLVYALRVEEKWKEVKTSQFPDTFFEVEPASPWNYGISAKHMAEQDFKVTVEEKISAMPWNLENAPIRITAQGKKIPEWTLQNHSAGKLPYPGWPDRQNNSPLEEITLIPYGCSTLRIAEFPVVDSHQK
jgi:uncharacterized protein